MAKPNANAEQFLEEYKGALTTKQRSAILNGLELSERLESYAEQALGLRPDLVETKPHTVIWSPPGAGKTFTVRNVANRANLSYIKYHGKATLNGFVMKMAVALHKDQTSPVIPVWIDDCDTFFSDERSLNFMKDVLDTDEGNITWDVNLTSQVASARKNGRDDLADALEYWNNGGVGIQIPMDRCRFIITTNKKLASKRDINKKKINMHEHAVRDRTMWRGFDINSEEAWGWMASTMISNDVFADDGFSLTSFQMYQLLTTFHTNWDRLSANSMRTVKDAGAMLYNNPRTFADEFEQNFLE
jgi:hypothetical protein